MIRWIGPSSKVTVSSWLDLIYIDCKELLTQKRFTRQALFDNLNVDSFGACTRVIEPLGPVATNIMTDAGFEGLAQEFEEEVGDTNVVACA
jgi:hypothetical protein